MTFEEANKLIEHDDPYWFDKKEREAFDSFGIKLTHCICEKCKHMLEGCKAIDRFKDDCFAITTCNYFSTIKE